MPEVGMDGQQKLKQAKVLTIGAGGLGSPLALYLAAVGVGRLGMVDFDVVDFTNLQRQIIHGTDDVGRLKLDSAKDTIRDINPNVEVVGYRERLTSANALEIFKDYDVIADGTDNFPTRYLVNDACVLLGKPNAYGSIFRFEGQVSVFDASRGPCYRCLGHGPGADLDGILFLAERRLSVLTRRFGRWSMDDARWWRRCYGGQSCNPDSPAPVRGETGFHRDQRRDRGRGSLRPDQSVLRAPAAPVYR